MPGRKAAEVELSERVPQGSEKLAARHTTGQQKAHRARIVLKAAERKKLCQDCGGLKISTDMATLWRERWLAPADIRVNDLSIEKLRATGEVESWDGTP
jgi:hypothetical protein